MVVDPPLDSGAARSCQTATCALDRPPRATRNCWRRWQTFSRARLFAAPDPASSSPPARTSFASRFDGEWKAAYAPFARILCTTCAEAISDSQATGISSISINDTNVKVRYVMQARSSEDLRGKELEPLHLLVGGVRRDNRPRPLGIEAGPAAALLSTEFVPETASKSRKTGGSTSCSTTTPRSVIRRWSREMFLAFLARPPRAPPLLSRP